MFQEPVRIQKFLADTGLCSRRAAETLIAEGQVWVNGTCAKIGQKITVGKDKITVQGEVIEQTAAPKITLAIHKSKGLTCDRPVKKDDTTIYDLLPRGSLDMRFICASRLDKDSQGLVIMTTDGDLANRLMSRSNLATKRYHVSLKDPCVRKDLDQLLYGLIIDSERVKVDYIAMIGSHARSSTELDVHMCHSKKRDLRQLLLAAGHTVKRIKRYQIGGFSLRGIPLRGAKQLSTKEIELLFQTANLKTDRFKEHLKTHED